MTIAKIKRPKQVYPLCEIWWDDASNLRHGWENRNEGITPQMVLSVGFLVAETPEHIILAMDVDDEGMHNTRSQIPKAMIRKQIQLKPKKKKVAIDQTNEKVQTIQN